MDFHIIGAGRGGTSLLAGLIDAHPRCLVRLEDYSLRYLIDASMAPGDRIRAYLSACRADAAVNPGMLWGHKTTSEQVLALGAEGVDLFLRLTAGIPALFILRDGRACVASKMARNNVPLDQAIERWKFSLELRDRLAANGRLHVVRFESLVAAPEHELRGVCAFLGIAYDVAMLAGTRSDKMRPEYRQDGFNLGAASIREQPPWVGDIAAELAANGYYSRRAGSE